MRIFPIRIGKNPSQKGIWHSSQPVAVGSRSPAVRVRKGRSKEGKASIKSVTNGAEIKILNGYRYLYKFLHGEHHHHHW